MGKTCRSCGREFSSGEVFCPTDGSRLSTPSQIGDLKQADPLIGTTLEGRYAIQRVIGEGGMGVVYEAQHVLIEKTVAIKVLRDVFTSRPDVVERFRQEAKSASKIGHPNIVDVSDFGETPSGQSYIVMEMLTGEDLADVLSRERILSPARAVRIAYQVARALHATHKKSIVHRDLKPENVYLIERDGAPEIVKVVDFGVAKMSDVEAPGGRRLTRTGMIFGTPEYMSPEQALGRPFDHRVDIYALGAICFELLTGRVPFEGENFMEILAKHGHARVPTLREANPGVQVSAALERVVMRALAKDPDQRYPSMGDLADDLRAVPEMPSVEPGDALEPLTVAAAERAVPEIGPALEAAVGQHTPANSVHSRRGRRGPRPHAPDPAAWRSQRRWWWAAATVSCAVLLVGLWLEASHRPEVTLSPVARKEPAPPVQSHPPLEATVSAATSAPATVDHPKVTRQPEVHAQVEVLVRTQPHGARVRALGTDAWCEQAPCSLSLPRGQPVTLRAEHGRTSVQRTMTFDDSTEIELKVGGRAAVKRAPRRQPRPMPSDLKIPAFLRDRPSAQRTQR